MQPIRAVGVPWYHAEDYPEILRISTDADRYPKTFDEWLAKAEHGLEPLEAQGLIVERVYIDPDEFTAWCAKEGLKIDTRARQRFCVEFIARKYHNQS